MPRDDAPVSRLELELWALGKLPPPTVADLVRACGSDPALAARATRVRFELSRAAQDLPPLHLPAPAPVSVWRSLWAPAGLALSMAAVALLTLAQVPAPALSGERAAVVWRGPLDVQLHRIRLGTAEPQGSLVMARPGDHLQYAVTAPKAGWLSVWNVQDDGHVQRYLAPDAVTPGQVVQGAVRLDAYPGAERVFFVLQSAPTQAEDMERAVQRGLRTPLADMARLPGLNATQRSVLVVKEPAS